MNRFADRDIFMYHHGGGIGHKGRGVSLEASRHHGTRIARGRQAKRKPPTLAAQTKTEKRGSATDHEGSSSEDGEGHAEDRPMQLEELEHDASRDNRDHHERGVAPSDDDSEASGEDSDRECDEADGDEEEEDGDTWGDEGGDMPSEGEDDYQEYVDDVYGPEGYAKL